MNVPCVRCGTRTYRPHTFSRLRVCGPCDMIQPATPEEEAEAVRRLQERMRRADQAEIDRWGRMFEEVA